MGPADTDSLPLYDGAALTAWNGRRQAAAISPASVDAQVAEALLALITRRCPDVRRVAVLIGAGGNGRQAAAFLKRCRTTAWQAVGVDGRQAQGAKGLLPPCDAIVDGLVGTGLHGPLSAPYRALGAHVRASGRPVFALDGPTGLDLATGRVAEGAIRAHFTLFCATAKVGALTGAGREYSGETLTAEVGVPGVLDEVSVCIPGARALQALVPRRPQDAHKGRAGTLAVVGGDRGMPGAVRMAATAAYRSGAGLVMAVVHAGHAAVLAAAFPELMAFAANARTIPWSRVDALLVGSGLGRRDWGARLWEEVLAMGQPLVVDGDGLYWLAQAPRARADWVLTPHEGEAARLLHTTVTAVSADRLAAAIEIARRFGGVCVLKGAGTLIAGGGRTWLCPAGNPGMATAGMGDALAGTIAGLMVQGLAPPEAARLGVFVHAHAGDRAAQAIGATGLLTSDLTACVPASLTALR